jgi:hypothetical protein
MLSFLKIKSSIRSIRTSLPIIHHVDVLHCRCRLVHRSSALSLHRIGALAPSHRDLKRGARARDAQHSRRHIQIHSLWLAGTDIFKRKRKWHANKTDITDMTRERHFEISTCAYISTYLSRIVQRSEPLRKIFGGCLAFSLGVIGGL